MTTTQSEGPAAGQEEQRPSDSPGWDATPGLKAEHNRQLAEVRGTALSNASRDQKNADRKAAPELAEQAEKVLDGLDEAKKLKPKNKGGRPKGKKSRPPEVIARERILRTINGLGEPWMKKLAEETPYLFCQLVKKVLPGTRSVGSDSEAAATRGPVELVLKLDRSREWKAPEPASGATVPDVLSSGQRPDELGVDRAMTFGDEAWSLGGRLGSRLRDDD